jgi:poly(hydroxyalkanoate) granule-associated protein
MTKKTRDELKDLPADLFETAHRVWLAGLGALASAEKEGNRYFRQLVERGREVEGRGRESVRGAGERMRGGAAGVGEKVREGAVGVGEALDARVTTVLHRLGVPTRNEIQDLTRRVEELNAKVERLRTPPPPAGAARPAPTKAVTPARPAVKSPKKGPAKP